MLALLVYRVVVNGSWWVGSDPNLPAPDWFYNEIFKNLNVVL